MTETHVFFSSTFPAPPVSNTIEGTPAVMPLLANISFVSLRRLRRSSSLSFLSFMIIS